MKRRKMMTEKKGNKLLTEFGELKLKNMKNGKLANTKCEHCVWTLGAHPAMIAIRKI